jgi:hypothetical protein
MPVPPCQDDDVAEGSSVQGGKEPSQLTVPAVAGGSEEDRIAQVSPFLALPAVAAEDRDATRSWSRYHE